MSYSINLHWRQKNREKGHLFSFLHPRIKKNSYKRQKPLFCFVLSIFVLFYILYTSCENTINIDGLKDSRVVFFNDSFIEKQKDDKDILFCNSTLLKNTLLESPEFKIIQDNTLVGVSPPSIIMGKVLGEVLGSVNQDKKEIVEYLVQSGDTLHSIANKFGISAETIALANNLSLNATLKEGEKLIILPVDGLLHIVKEGDTLSEIAKDYQASLDEIVVFNELENEHDIYVGDILIIPGGKIPSKPSSSSLAQEKTIPQSYFIIPTEGRITQGLHYYNAIDIANNCGTPIYAVAAGIVQRVKYGWNFGGGNYLTILHPNGVVTYYGHLKNILVAPGQRVSAGDKIALMGGKTGTLGDGISTGCHLHFQVIGAKNPLAKYRVGTYLKY